MRDDEKVDLVVVLSHLGFPQDVQMAKEVGGIDVLLSSHTHNRLYRPVHVNGAILIQSGSHGWFLGRLDLTVEDRRVIDYRHQLIVVGEDIQPEATVQDLVDQALRPPSHISCSAEVP